MSRSRSLVLLALLVGALFGTAVCAHAATTRLDAHGSVEQAYATGLAPRSTAKLKRHGRLLQTVRADRQGGVLFSGLHPGGGYRISAAGRRSAPLTVMTARDAPPSTNVYDQSITAQPGQGELTAPDPANYQYLSTRDGTKLAIDVHPPAVRGRGRR